MPKKNPYHPLTKIPEVCETCSQKIDVNSAESIAEMEIANAKGRFD